MASKWTREQIIREILRRESTGLPLTPGGEQGVEFALYQAAARIFGSWRYAVQAAGITSGQVGGQVRWSPARILGIIRALSNRRQPLSAAEIQLRHGDLVSAARRIFGSWPKAVIAAGVDPAKLSRVVPWTRERVIEAILTRALRNEPLRTRTVKPRSLVVAGQRIFGCWGAALDASGVDPKHYVRHWPVVGTGSLAGHRAFLDMPQILTCKDEGIPIR
jgi:hypothetical protein